MGDSSLATSSRMPPLSRNDRSHFRRSIHDSASKFAFSIKDKLTSLERTVRRRNKFTNLDDDSQTFGDDDYEDIGFDSIEYNNGSDGEINDHTKDTIEILSQRKRPGTGQAVALITEATKLQKEVGRRLAKQFARCRVWQTQASGNLIARKSNKSKQKTESTKLLEDCEEERFNTLLLKDQYALK